MSASPGTVVPSPAAQKRAPEHPFPRSYTVALICTILAGAILTGLLITKDYRDTIERTQALLSRSSEETASALQAWLRSTRKQATVIAEFPAIVQAVSTENPAATAHANEVVDHFRAPFLYAAIYAIDATGATKARTSGAPPLPAWLRIEATRNPRPRTLASYEPGAEPGFPQLAILVPIHGTSLDAAEPAGTLIILTERNVLAAHIEPLGADIPIRSLLFGRNPQGAIVYFSRLQHPAPPGVSWRDEAAEAALRGETKFMLRRAGDGTLQYAMTRPLPEFGWGIVTRQLRAEVLAPVYRMATISVLIFLVAAGLLVTFAIALWRYRQVHGLREEMQRRAIIEEELRQSEERFNKAFTSCPDAMSLTTAKDGRFIDVNEAFANSLGYRREELIGHSSIELGLWADTQDRTRLTEALQRKELVRNWRIQGRLKGGGSVEVELSGEIVHIQGEPCLLLVLRDITHQLLLEEQLRQAQKMEAMGRLAGGIAHDFNNMLAVISLSCEMLGDDLTPQSPQVRKLQIMRNACDRAAGLTRQLLAFSRQQVMQPKVLELNAVVLETKGLLERLISEPVKVQLELSKTPIYVCMDVGQLVQVLMNLTVNARDAMRDGGTLTIRTEHRDRLPQAAGPAGREEKYALLSVIDTGVGISESVKEHIFEPFFTTKKEGEGTGLGLATVYGVIQQSRGQIFVESEAGCGATFHVYLPEVAPELSAVETKTAKQQGAVVERILLVEDDPAIRKLTRELLEVAGYKVLEAADGAEGLELFTSRSESIDLVITDVLMPHMNGRALATAVRAHSPHTKVLFMSAYSETRQAAFELDTAETGFIQKPFGRPELLSKVHDLLQQKGVKS